MLKKILFMIILSTFVQITTKSDIKWKFDNAHTKILFNVTHMVINDVTGNFRNFEGSVTTNDNADLNNGKIDFTVDVTSINTDNERRDNHLKSDDFFNAEKYPNMTFKSKSIKKEEDNKYKVTGDLTIRDVTKPVTLDVVYNGSVKDKNGKLRQGYKASTTINRFDYNLKWNALIETGGAVVGKDVRITCDIELLQE